MKTPEILQAIFDMDRELSDLRRQLAEQTKRADDAENEVLRLTEKLQPLPGEPTDEDIRLAAMAEWNAAYVDLLFLARCQNLVRLMIARFRQAVCGPTAKWLESHVRPVAEVEKPLREEIERQKPQAEQAAEAKPEERWYTTKLHANVWVYRSNGTSEYWESDGTHHCPVALSEDEMTSFFPIAAEEAKAIMKGWKK